MATLSDLKARLLASVTGKRNRTDAEMAYYQLAVAGAIPITDPPTTAGVLTWDSVAESWVVVPFYQELGNYLMSVPGWNADVAQALQHDAAGNLVWVAA